MSFALWVLILYSGLMLGYVAGMERKLLDLEVGDIQIFAADYRNSPSLHTRISESDALLAGLRERGFAAAGRLLAFGMVAAEESSAGASFRGVDLEADASVSQIASEVGAGEWLDPADRKGVVLGRRLARTLGVSPGAEVLALSEAADGSMAYDLFRVRGVLRGISDTSDQSMYMTAPVFRELFEIATGIHQVVLQRPGGTELPAAAALVHDALSARAAELEIKTWRELLPTMASLLDSVSGLMVALFIVFYIAIAMLILNAMLMSVFERVREFGVLKALGVGPIGVLRLILVESAIQTVVAIGIATLLAIPAILYLARTGLDMASLAGVSVMGVAMDPIWRAAIEARVFISPIGTLVFMVGIAVLYPAGKAALIRPVEAMRHH